MRLLCSAPRRQDGGPRGLARRPLDAYGPQRYYSTRAAHVYIDIDIDMYRYIIFTLCATQSVTGSIREGACTRASPSPSRRGDSGYRGSGGDGADTMPPGDRRCVLRRGPGGACGGVHAVCVIMFGLRTPRTVVIRAAGFLGKLSRIRPIRRRCRRRPGSLNDRVKFVINTRAHNPRDTLSSAARFLAPSFPPPCSTEGFSYFIPTPIPMLRAIIYKHNNNNNIITQFS